jgi:hypothetical protein
MANPLIKIKRGSVTPSSLQPGELAVDLTAKTIFVGQNNTVPLAIGGEGVFATKVYTDNAVAAANTTLTAAILAEETARIAADGVLQSNITAEASSRSTADSVLQTNITAEETARIAADGVLQTNINAEKGRIDAILTASTADKDSFAEIVSLINSVDTENDTAFGAYVVSNNTALAAESSTRAADDATLQANLNAAESALQSSIATETTNRTTADTTLQSNITAEATSRAAADTTLQSNITAEETSRTTADSTLQANIDAEMTARTTADTALSGRSATLETKTTGIAYAGGVTTLTGDLSVSGSITDATIDGGTFA